MKITKKALLIIALFMVGFSLSGWGEVSSANTPANQSSVTQTPSQITPQQTNQNQQSPKHGTDWQYIGESTNPTYGSYYAYADKSTIVKSGDSITFWEMTRYYKLSASPILRGDRPLKWMIKYKLLTKSQEYIILESNSYDSNDKEVFHQKYGDNGLAPISVKKATPLLKQEIDFVLQNAKESTDTGVKPNPSYKEPK